MSFSTNQNERWKVNRTFAEMLKGGVIMDVVDSEQAKLAEQAGAQSVMALEQVPSDIRRDGGIARMSDPKMIEGIQKAVSIPVRLIYRCAYFKYIENVNFLHIS